MPWTNSPWKTSSVPNLVKLRYFGGLNLAEAAQALGVSERTADNYWAHAKAWLIREMREERLKAKG